MVSSEQSCRSGARSHTAKPITVLQETIISHCTGDPSVKPGQNCAAFVSIMAGIWFALALLSISEVSSLKICSFNIQSFGERKMEKTEVVDVILDVSTSDVVHLLRLYIVNHSLKLNPLNRTEM